MFISNGFDKDMIKPFLTEFSKKFIIGKTLSKMKHDPQYFEKIRNTFSQTSKDMIGLWDALETAIVAIGDANHLD